VTDSTAARPALDHARLAPHAPGLPPGWNVEVLPETPSTNAYAAARARAGAPEGYVVTTEHQTAGRGRLDRGWETPARSALALSVVLRPGLDVPPARWPWLPLMAGVAVARTVGAMGVDAGVKWPNDVLVGTIDDQRDLKVCGILVERVEPATRAGRAGDRPAAVVGIGLNTSQTRAELPVATATSLALETRAAVDRTAVLLALLAQLREAYELWRLRPADLAEEYVRLSATLGRRVRAELPDGGHIDGSAVRIDPDGRLVIEEDGGAERVVGAGDVVHARLQ